MYGNRGKKFLFLIIILCLLTPVRASADENESLRTVRVGIADTPYFSQKQEDGSYEGILIDYLNQLSKYAGWRLEYVEGSLNDLIWKLADGEVDLMGSILKNEDTENLYDFATYNSGSSYGVLLTKAGRQEFVPKDFSSFNGIKVGIYSKAAHRISDYENYCKVNDLDFDEVYFDGDTELRKALDDGTVDAILTNDMNCRPDEQILDRFAATPYYFAVTKGNKEILHELNNALSTLRQVSPQFEEDMYQKHILTRQQAAMFTSEERSFIKEGNPLRVAVCRGFYPSSDWEDETPVGIAADVLKLIGENTGLQFTYVPADTLVEAREMVRDGEADMTLCPSGSSLKDPDLISTKAYLDSQMITVYNLVPKEKGKGVAAVLDGYSSEDTGQVNYQTYDTMSEFIDAVVQGRAESLTVSALLLENYPTLNANQRLYLTPVPSGVGNASFLIKAPANPVVISILDKAIQNLPSQKIQEIVYQHTVSQLSIPSLSMLYYIYPTEFAWAVAGVFLIVAVVAVLFLLLNRTRLKLVREKILQEESYRIVGEMSGEEIIIYDFSRHQLQLPAAFAAALGIEQIQKVRRDESEEAEPLCKILEVFQTVKDNREQHLPTEFSCRLSDGSEGWFRIVGTVLFDKDGKPVRGIGGLRSIQREVHHLKNLEKQANTDYLTGLSNRQYSEQLIRSGFEEHGSGALLIMDIDHFKKINDLMGHTGGDIVLRDFAELLRREFRMEDVIGRWGGDEFIAFVGGMTDQQLVLERVSHLCKVMNREFQQDGKAFLLSISIGVALASDGISYQELFQKADQALYHVKNTTRNGYCLAE